MFACCISYSVRLRNLRKPAGSDWRNGSIRTPLLIHQTTEAGLRYCGASPGQHTLNVAGGGFQSVVQRKVAVIRVNPDLNVFNAVQFGGIGTNIESANFRQVTTPAN